MNFIKQLLALFRRNGLSPQYSDEAFRQQFLDNVLQEMEQKPKKRPRLYKQATVVTTGELPKEKKVPLKKSTSAKAFKENVAKEVKEGGKPVKQAVAIAYAVKREASKSKGKKK